MERGDPGGFTLPVVEEAASEKSGQSNEPSPSPSPSSRVRAQEEQEEGPSRSSFQRPPPTPPKDYPFNGNHRPPTPPKDWSLNKRAVPPTPPKDERKHGHHANMNKALPAPPPADSLEAEVA
jgi:1-phosphatidylinositol-4-phosphate 5-kinase